MIISAHFVDSLRQMRHQMLGADVAIEDDMKQDLRITDSRGAEQVFPYQVCRWQTGEGAARMRHAVLLRPILKRRHVAYGWPVRPFTVWEMDAEAMHRELRGYIDGARQLAQSSEAQGASGSPSSESPAAR